MHGMVMLDNFLYEKSKRFEVHYNAPTLAPYTIAGNINLPKTQCLTLANYLNKDFEEAEQCDIYDKLINL